MVVGSIRPIRNRIGERTVVAACGGERYPTARRALLDATRHHVLYIWKEKGYEYPQA